MHEDATNLPTRPPAERVFVSSVGGERVVTSDVGHKLAGVARTGFGTLASTVRWMGWLAVGLAVAAGYVAGQKSGTAGFLAVLIALGVTAISGFVLAVQRAGLLAAADGIQASGIASKLLNVVFDKVMGVSPAATPGTASPGHNDAASDAAPSSVFTRTAGRVPLSQAEALLSDAVQNIDAGVQVGGVFGTIFRRTQDVIVSTIRRMTLARFRKENAAGGIDLAKVRDELASVVDDTAANAVRRRVLWMTIGYVLAVSGVVLAVAWGLRSLFAR